MNPWPFVGLSIVGTIGTVVGFRGFLDRMTRHAGEELPETDRWRWTKELLIPYGLLVFFFGVVGVVGDIGLVHYVMSQ